MNENKKGKPYSYPDSFILVVVVGYMRIYIFICLIDKPRES